MTTLWNLRWNTPRQRWAYNLDIKNGEIFKLQTDRTRYWKISSVLPLKFGHRFIFADVDFGYNRCLYDSLTDTTYSVKDLPDAERLAARITGSL